MSSLLVLWRFVRADVCARPLLAVLTALVVAMATTTLTLALAVGRATGEPFDRAFAESRGPDVVVTATDPRADLERLRRLPQVAAAAGPWTEVNRSLRAGGRLVDARVRGLPPGRPAVDRPRVTEGRWLGSGEAVVERTFSRALRIRAGERLTIGGRRFVVAGLASTTGVGAYPDFNPGLVWVPARELAPRPRERTQRVLALRLADRAAAGEVVERARDLGPGVRARDWRAVQESYAAAAETAAIALRTFSAFALVAVVLIAANASAGRVLARRREIGLLLRSVGVTPGGATLLLAAEALALGLLGAVCGIAAAAPLGPVLLDRTADLLGTSGPLPVAPQIALTALAVVMAPLAAFALFPAWRAARTGALAALRERRSRLAAIAMAVRLPAAVAVGVKDVFARRARALLTVAGLALTVTTVVVALGTEAIYDAVVADPARDGVPFDLSVRAATLDDAGVRAFVDRERDVLMRAFTVTESSGRLDGDSITVRAVGDVLGARPAAASYPATAGRRIAAAGEALASRGLLARAGLRIGDRVTVSVGGRPMSVRIVGRGIEPRSPDSLTVTADTLPTRMPEEGLPLTALVLRPGADAHAAAGRLERASQGRLDVTVIADVYAADRDGLRPVLAALDLVLLLIALVNLMTTMLLGARERARDLALLKAVGMTPRQVVVGMAAGNALLACLAVAGGIPLGLLLFRTLVRFASPSDAADITVDPSAAALLLLVPGAIALATVAAAVAARRVARLPVVQTLSDE